MKKFLKVLLILFLILFLLVAGILSAVFFKPEWFLNTRNLSWGLDRISLIKKWSWQEASMTHGWYSWDRRRFSGDFSQFCLNVLKEPHQVDGCFERLSWDVEWSVSLTDGFKVKTLEPLIAHSKKLNVLLGKTPEDPPPSSPPDLWRYWSLLWSDISPDLDLRFDEIALTKEGKTTIIGFDLTKTSEKLLAHTLELTLEADPKGFTISLPEKYPFPKKFKLMDQMYFYKVRLLGKMSPENLKLHLTGALEAAEFEVDSRLDFPLEHNFDTIGFRREFLLSTKGQILIPAFKKNLARLAPDPFKELPAPFNVMDGTITLHTKHAPLGKDVRNDSILRVNLTSEKQVLDFSVNTQVPLLLKELKPGAIDVSIDFHKMAIQLPRLSKKEPPPQFMPDGRFKTGKPKPEATKPPPDIDLHLQALGEKAMQFRTNLLDEMLRLNFDLLIQQGTLQKGFLNILPLKTTVFKRPIRVNKLLINFQHPKPPVLSATIKFPLPEYKITLKLEGPVSKPRYSFTSEPPLPQNDIYAVLLFGRPMSDLGDDDKTAAQKTNQLLSQGILSLSVLYFLAGSPVEYVGFDPGSKNATAQFGLNSKTSLRVGGGQEGVNSSAIRRSLGKGWYLDTSVQNQTPQGTNRGARDYGVLLERVITY